MNSEQPTFLVWLVLVVAGSWLISGRWVGFFLASSSGVFLAVYDPLSLLTLSVITLLCGLAIRHSANFSGAIPSVITLFVGFFLLYRFLKHNTDVLLGITLLGMAFYILRAIHLLVDCHTGRQNQFTWPELFSWLWFLPTLQVGPVHRFAPFQQDLMRRRWDSRLFSSGLERLVIGFFKVIVVGNYLINVKYNQWLTQFPPDSWSYHYFDSVRYGLHLYFKFAGYSDIAIGFALLLGFRVAENFNFPFLASNIIDFWNRWHISLSRWCRDYVYTPVLAYSRKPTAAAISSMIVLGVWHELSVQYLLWGIWHGFGIAVCQAWGATSLRSVLNSGWKAKVWRLTAIVITLNFVIFSFTFTSTDSAADTMDRWKVLLGIAS